MRNDCGVWPAPVPIVRMSRVSFTPITHDTRSPRPIMRSLPLLAIALVAAPAYAQRPDSATFVTRLGADTLVVERVVRSLSSVRAEVLLRTPGTTHTVTTMTLGPDGMARRWESITRGVNASGRATGAELRRETVTIDGPTLNLGVSGSSVETVARGVAAPAATLPWMDYVHWPYELALVRLAPGSGERVQPMLSGQRPADFRVARTSADSATVTHPFRGTMRVRTDASGRILGLDAGATTRKLVVERRPWMPDAQVAAIASRWAARDAQGKPFGALSGRGETSLTTDGARVTVNFGTPAVRGREIWGALVPYGQVWRTGANEATHLETDHDLVLGAGSDTLLVPAGRYTLYTIPEATGGTLIVNRQTGQGGTTYDAARDLGRVRLTARQLAAPLELFDIALDRAMLRIRWADRELVVPMRVR
jgi:hypothetical protein